MFILFFCRLLLAIVYYILFYVFHRRLWSLCGLIRNCFVSKKKRKSDLPMFFRNRQKKWYSYLFFCTREVRKNHIFQTKSFIYCMYYVWLENGKLNGLPVADGCGFSYRFVFNCYMQLSMCVAMNWTSAQPRCISLPLQIACSFDTICTTHCNFAY